LRSEDGQSQIASRTVGTSQPKLALFRIGEVVVPIPPEILMKKSKIVLSAYSDMIENLKKKNIVLIRTRDMLLPKLITGELDVSEMNICSRSETK